MSSSFSLNSNLRFESQILGITIETEICYEYQPSNILQSNWFKI